MGVTTFETLRQQARQYQPTDDRQTADLVRELAVTDSGAERRNELAADLEAQLSYRDKLAARIEDTIRAGRVGSAELTAAIVDIARAERERVAALVCVSPEDVRFAGERVFCLAQRALYNVFADVCAAEREKFAAAVSRKVAAQAAASDALSAECARFSTGEAEGSPDVV